jgi:hypothetical protein
MPPPSLSLALHLRLPFDPPLPPLRHASTALHRPFLPLPVGVVTRGCRLPPPHPAPPSPQSRTVDIASRGHHCPILCELEDPWRM